MDEQSKDNALSSAKKTRYHLLDFIRGLTLVSMIAYHLIWDLVYLFGVNMPWYDSPLGYTWQQSICYTFILLSGFCVKLGKHTLRRGLIVLGSSIVVSAVTAIFMPDAIIKYGVLTLIGCCMLISFLFDKKGKKIHPVIGLIVCIVLFVFTRNVYLGNLGFENWKLVELPQFLYQNDITAFFGFPHKQFFSSDYFPLFPWIFLFFAGYFFHGVFEKFRWMRPLSVNLLPPLQFIGKHTLPIYMIHQPVVYGILYLIFL